MISYICWGKKTFIWQNDIQKAEENKDNENIKCYEVEPSLEFVEDASHHVTRNLTIDVGECANVSNGAHEKAASFDLQTSSSSEALKPCGHINSCMVVSRDTLYIYGGMMEVRDREVTLDDLYMLNLSKLDEWKMIPKFSLLLVIKLKFHLNVTSVERKRWHVL
ncbi:hypothetical protein AAC387_Pa06g1693 [Persea americana]